VISFIEKTWFLWWIFTVFMILRWFHTSSAGCEEEYLDLISDGQQAFPQQSPLPEANRILVGGDTTF
jgi:hypothetical protein